MDDGDADYGLGAEVRPQPTRPMPDPEPPVIVFDKKYTLQPTKNRAVLADCIHDLALEVRTAMDLDYAEKQRYCRRMRLENQVDNMRTEEIEVTLPRSLNCWHSLDAEELETHMLDAILDNIEDLEHMWYRLRVKLDHFMDPLVNLYLDALETNDLLSKVKFDEIEEDYRRHMKETFDCQSLQDRMTASRHINDKYLKPRPKGATKTPVNKNKHIRPNPSGGASKAPELINLCDDDDCVIIE